MPKLIIFDYDGVLADTFADLYIIYKKICKAVNKKCPSNLEEFRKVYGKNYLECVKNLGFSKKDIKVASGIYHREIAKQRHKLFKGVKTLLKTLSKQYTLALISGNAQDIIMKTLKNHNIEKYFSAIKGAGQIDKSKELASIAKELGFTKSESVMVGDRTMDRELAKKAGYKNVIIVGYGWEKNKSTIRKPMDLLEVLKRWK